MLESISRPRLRFRSELREHEFRDEYARSIVVPARAALALVIAIFLANGAFYAWADRAGAQWGLRAGIIAALSAILVSTWHPAFVRAQPWILSSVALASAGVTLAIRALPPVTRIPSYPWIGITVIATFALLRIRFPIAFAASLIMLGAYAVLVVAGEYPTEDPFPATMFLLASTVIGVFAGWNIEVYARRRFLARKGLEAEQARSERLLLNVLPEPIAKRLKTDPAPIADRFPEASILFADIAGFTELSTTMDPEALVKLLNEHFTELDVIAGRHGLEKIKTIGDAYMAVSGVPVSCSDHLERVADAALEIRAVTAERAASSADVISGGGLAWAEGDRSVLEVRIGIDTGPVVAGVIGERKFTYDLWGDPVTMASRMERHGVVGEIQVTEAVWERLRDRYVLSPRGVIDVKGRGETTTFFLRGRLSDAASGEE
jgi:class 3 adenylate cyclase